MIFCLIWLPSDALSERILFIDLPLVELAALPSNERAKLTVISLYEIGINFGYGSKTTHYFCQRIERNLRVQSH